MTTTIAISGKGGSGKTTLAAMMVRILREKSQGAILAVDADPNSCLAFELGVETISTIAELREQARAKEPGDAGGDKLRSLEYGIAQAVTEADGFDLLSMGRPEGPSCYCAVNNLLRNYLDKLSSQYKYVIIDNEAGMEHLSRRTTNNVDFLCIVSAPTAIGVVTAERIVNLAKKLPIVVKEAGLIWNNASENSDLQLTIENNIEIFGEVPHDKALLEASMQGKSTFELEQDNPALLAVRKILKNKLNLPV